MHRSRQRRQSVAVLTKSMAFVWLILILLAVTQSYGKKGVVGKLMGIFGSLYSNEANARILISQLAD